MRRRKQNTDTLAKLGALSIILIAVVVIVLYVVTNFGPRQNGYQIGVHFRSAAGLSNGAQTFLSGVVVGNVDQVKILPDNTIETIVTIRPGIEIPVGSTFLIAAPLTGAPALLISAPPPSRAPGFLPHRILPIAEQPIGSTHPSIADLMLQGQGVAKRIPTMFSELQHSQRSMLASLRSAQANGTAIRYQMRGNASEMSGRLGATMRRAAYYSRDIATTLKASNLRNRATIDSLTQSLKGASAQMSESVEALRAISTDPSVKINVTAAKSNLRDTLARMSEVTQDLRAISTDPQTRMQLLDIAAQLKATLQKLRSIAFPHKSAEWTR